MMAAHPETMILFTDIEMPGMIDGIELASQVHRLKCGVGVIVTSGRDHGLRPADLPSYDAFLGKPYRAQELLDAVDIKIAQKGKRPTLQ